MSSINSSSQLLLDRSDAPAARKGAAPEDARAALAEAQQKNGKRMVIAGFVITIVGVVLYCAVNFAGGVDAGMDNALFSNGVPFNWATLAILGLGTLVWLAGSFTYLRGMMDAEEDAHQERGASK